MNFSDFPDMDYEYYQMLTASALFFYNNKINELKKQFQDL